MGWHPQDEDFTTRKQQEKSVVPVPEIQMEWDEASCGQLVWLYNEAISHYDGHTESFFNALPARTVCRNPVRLKVGRCAWHRSTLAAGQRIWPSSIISLMTASARTLKLPPHLLFREGFKVAGDDMLLDVIQRCVLPALQTRLQQAGVTDAAALLATLFGDSGRIDTRAILRQQTALQLFMPLGHAVLSAREQSDINDPVAGLHATFGELLSQRPTRNVMNYIQQAIDHALPAGSPAFDVLSVPLQVQFRQLQEALLAGQFT